MLTREEILKRNELIKENGKQTRLKRKEQYCKTFRFKIDCDRLNLKQKEQLKMMFVEAKWVYNYLISQDDVFNIDYKSLKQITRLDKDKNVINTEITYLGSSVKQELIMQIVNQIKGLSKLKKNGYEVGKLKFKSEFNSIKLKQYNITHYIKNNKFKVQGINGTITILGTKQLKKYKNKLDYTTANIIYDGINYYICLTCFIDKEEINNVVKPNDILGIDMGIEKTIITSNGDKIDVSIGESERLKRLQRKLAKQIKGSNNWYKTKYKLKKEYIHIVNKRNDIANKVVHQLINSANTIIMQDEQIHNWIDDTSNNSKAKIQYSALGRIKAKLMYYDNVIVLDRWFPTTQYCTYCGNKTNLEKTDRIYKCKHCGKKEDRDIHAANNMIYFYQQYKDRSGTGQTSKLVAYKSYKKFVAEQENTTSLA